MPVLLDTPPSSFQSWIGFLSHDVRFPITSLNGASVDTLRTTEPEFTFVGFASRGYIWIVDHEGVGQWWAVVSGTPEHVGQYVSTESGLGDRHQFLYVRERQSLLGFRQVGTGNNQLSYFNPGLHSPSIPGGRDWEWVGWDYQYDRLRGLGHYANGRVLSFDEYGAGGYYGFNVALSTESENLRIPFTDDYALLAGDWWVTLSKPSTINFYPRSPSTLVRPTPPVETWVMSDNWDCIATQGDSLWCFRLHPNGTAIIGQRYVVFVDEDTDDDIIVAPPVEPGGSLRAQLNQQLIPDPRTREHHGVPPFYVVNWLYMSERRADVVEVLWLGSYAGDPRDDTDPLEVALALTMDTILQSTDGYVPEQPAAVRNYSLTPRGRRYDGFRIVVEDSRTSFYG